MKKYEDNPIHCIIGVLKYFIQTLKLWVNLYGFTIR